MEFVSAARPSDGAWLVDVVKPVLVELRRDAAVFALIGVYVLAAPLFVAAVGGRQYSPLAYLPIWFNAFVAFGCLYLLVAEVPRAIRRSPAHPICYMIARLPKLATPRAIAGVILYFSLALFYATFTSVKVALPMVGGFRFDGALGRLDWLLHGGIDPWRILQPVLGHHWMTRVIEVSYSIVWWVMVLWAPLLVASARRLSALRLRFLVTLILCWVLLGNVLAGLTMSAGPAYYAAVTGDTHRYGDLLSYLAFSPGHIHSVVGYQNDLWAWFARGELGPAGGISAFPSLHVSMVTLFFLAARHVNKPVAAIVGAFAVLIVAGSVHLGWHYAVDGYASIVLTGLLWVAVGQGLAWFGRPASGPADRRERGLNSAGQFVDRERFAQNRIPGDDALDGLGVRIAGDQDDWQIAMLSARASGALGVVHTWHGEIDDRQVRSVVLQAIEAHGTLLGLGDLPQQDLAASDDEPPHIGVVIDDRHLLASTKARRIGARVLSGLSGTDLASVARAAEDA